MARRGVAAAVMAAVLVGGCGGTAEDPASGDLSGQWDTLREAGTVSVTFDGILYVEHPISRTSGLWEGTSVVALGDPVRSDTTYTTADSSRSDGRTVSRPMRELRVGDDRWYQGKNLRSADGRPWIHRTPSERLIDDGGYGDPTLRVTDLSLWLEFLRELPGSTAVASKNDALKDLPGAPREYHVVCAYASDFCPKATMGRLDSLFETVSQLNFDVWAGEDGRLRQLAVTITFLDDTSAGQVPYKLKANFSVTGFGAPLTVTPPPAGEVSR